MAVFHRFDICTSLPKNSQYVLDTAPSKKIDNDVMLANCEIIIIVPVYAIQSNPEAQFRMDGLQNLHFHQ